MIFKKLLHAILLMLLLAFAVQGLWLAVQPLVPYLLIGLVLVLILGLLYNRATRL